jgi:hypothetical protein
MRGLRLTRGSRFDIAVGISETVPKDMQPPIPRSVYGGSEFPLFTNDSSQA